MTSIKNLKKKYDPFYKSLGSVFCPILQTTVHFSNVGWTHIRFDSHGHRRFPSDIAMRFKLLPYVPGVVKGAKSYLKEEGILKNGNKIIFYEIAYLVEVNNIKKHVTVIISQIINQKSTGKLHYLSARYTRFKKQKSP